MTQPVGKPHHCVLGNLAERSAGGGVASPLFVLPAELLDTITRCVATGATAQAAAAHAIGWGRVSVSTHRMTHESCIESVINHAKHLKHLDEALVILWQHGIAPLIGARLGANGPQATSVEEIRRWMMDPINTPLLDTITAITLAGTGLKVIPPEINTLRNLQELKLSYNQITQVGPLAFTGCLNLQELELNDNQIAQMDPQAFANCVSLLNLYLNSNRIAQVGPLAFTGCLRLQKLYLEHNQITQVDPQAFTGCPTLAALRLDYNQIAQITPQTFASCPALMSLCLNNNQITQIDSQAFASCPALEELYLNNNQITLLDPQTFASCPALMSLSLNNNQITLLDPQTFASCPALMILSLNNNQITLLDPQTFASCPVLLQLFLTNNPLLFADASDLQVHYYNTFKAFSRYVCRSELATFYKAISQGKRLTPEIVEDLKHLEDRNLIYEMVYREAVAAAEKEGRAFSTDGDLQWGEHHVCDDMPIFYRALKRVVEEKFGRLSTVQKCAVRGMIYEMAREDGGLNTNTFAWDDPNWEKTHRNHNVLRFIDAMKGVL